MDRLIAAVVVLIMVCMVCLLLPAIARAAQAGLPILMGLLVVLVGLRLALPPTGRRR